MRATSAVAIAILLTSTAIPALGQTVGGSGGNAGGAGTGGSGGTSAATVPGAGGSNGLAGAGGGGGGGAGTAGGVGGTGAGPSGGAGVAVAGADGNAGGANSGGAGGTGGDHGAVVTTTSSNAGAINGGTGGNGGAGGTGGGGGGGAAGGYGVVLNGAAITYSNSGTITAGNGGNGGAASSAGAAAGNGGGGGYGVFFNAAATLSNSGTITGGNGGAAGTTSGGATAGSVGLGGQGVIGSGITIINSGTITGGLNGDGVTRVDAIQFLSGSNTLTLQNGSTIAGNIELDGNASVTFNQSTAQTLGNVITGVGGSVVQSGAGALTLSGANTYTGGTTINIATLAVANNSALGTGTLEINGGTLQAGAAGLTIANAINIANNGGTIDTNGNNLTLSGVIADQTPGIPGLFTKIGSGMLTLSGANTFTGGTEVERGTLQIAGSGTLGGTGSNVTVTSDGVNPAGILDLGGTTQTLNGAGGINLRNGGTIQNGTLSSSAGFNFESGTVSAVLAGTSALSKTTTGTVILSGANTYTGATTISAGTLAISGAGAIASSSGVTDNGTFDISGASGGVSIANLAGSGTVVLGARTLALTNASGSFDGTIGGTGGIAVNAGSFTLTASNSYTGTTTIASGATLALSGSGAIAGSSVTDNGTFDISAASGNISLASLAGSGSLALGTNSLTLTAAAGTFSGVIAGSGGLTVNGGTETLSGVNTYTGATSIASGATLALSGAGSIAASSGVADSGTFDISASSAGVSIKTLSGGGAVKLGSNTLTLTNAAGTFSGVISGSGGLTLGAGTETLSGANTYTGATTVNAGALTVMGSLAGPVTVAGGKLNGTGTVGAINVTSGTLAPGDAIGTLHANGNVALGNGTTFASEVSPSAADELVATGNVTIGSATTLAITQDAGTYSAHDYTLISAASVSGTFTTVTGASFTGLNSTIQYSATAVDLILTAPSSSSSSSSSPPPPPGSPPTITFLFGTFGQTPNQIAAGNAVTASPSNATLYTTLGAVVTSGASAMPAALAQLSGDIHASLRSALVEDGKIIRDTVINHAIAGGDGVTVWAAGFGAYGSIDSDGNAAAVHHNDSGVILGADVPVAEGFNLGGGFAFTSQHANLPTETASATGSTNHVIGYANWTDQTWVASLGVDYGWGSNRVTRQITSFSETDSDHQSNGLTQIFGEVGYRIPADTFDLMALEPYVNLADVSARTGAFTETGGVAALDGGAKSASENYLTVGVRAAAPSWSVGDLGVVPNLNVGWQHAFTRFLPSQTLTFAETSQSFTVLGVPLGTDAATIQAGLDISLSPATILSIGYDGEISNRAEDHAVRAELSWKF